MLDYIMKAAAHNASRQFEVLDHVNRNVGNFNTTGYKNTRFEQYLSPDGRVEGIQKADVSQGDFMITGRETDIAIEGTGYLPVTQPDGTVAYTRDGSFSINSEGYLTTQHGDLIGTGIQLPADYQKIQIHPDGTVKITTKPGMNFKDIGKLSLVRFNNPAGLKTLGHNKLAITAASGEPISDPDSKLKQGSLERANVNLYGQIDQVLRLNAGIISNMRIIKFADDLYRQSVNLKQ